MFHNVYMWWYACYASLCYQLPIYFQKFPDVSGAPVICAHVPKIAQVLPAKTACASGIYAHICAAYHGVACFMIHGASPEMPVVCCALLRARDLRACAPDYRIPDCLRVKYLRADARRYLRA